ncbi:hypothetical protein SAY87_023106 [Trapa incisa]|uniref:Uncharacterized protein n=1 Tax=Trapa incisa TaxID=236973 RepID=A0AAN7K3R9_9MYRT|nr:hypothetical protein SAY87_023106 [Trapa incisa]
MVSVLNYALKGTYNAEKRENRFARLCRNTFGYIVLGISAGIMDHEEARRKNVCVKPQDSSITRRTLPDGSKNKTDLLEPDVTWSTTENRAQS